MTNNKFCIVVTTRNSQKYIRECLLSIQEQRYLDWKCIVIDDASNDFTPSIIKETVGTDSRFQLIFNNERKWCLANRIKGNHTICTDDEDIIIDVDGDDKLENSGVLDYLNQVYQNRNVWITYGQFRRPNQNNSQHCRAVYEPFYRFKYEEFNISHLRTYKYWLFKKIKEEDLKDKNGDYYRCVGDMAVMFPMCEMAGKHLKFIPKVLYVYNNEAEGNIIQTNKDSQINNGFELMTKPAYKMLSNKEDTLEQKISIKIFDKNFTHNGEGTTTTNFENPRYIEWYRGPENRPYTFYTDKCLQEVVNAPQKTMKIAWLLEPIDVSPDNYKWIMDNWMRFHYVLTYDKYILDRIPNSVYIADGCSWGLREQWKIYPKIRKVCLMASKKKDCDGHKLRYEILNKCGQFLTTVYGISGSEHTDVARMGIIKDYQYVIETQNCKRDWYFTQRLIDCFLVGAVPIYWGCPEIAKFFNPNGILVFDNINELRNILVKINQTDYNSRQDAIRENFVKAHQFVSMEDYIYLHFIRKIQQGFPIV